jgi:hypothetical protein
MTIEHRVRRGGRRLLRSAALEALMDRIRRQQHALGRRLNPELHPRIWSNAQLRLFASKFEGDVANVSGWQDADKQGLWYRQYFSNCRSYTVTNRPSGARADHDGSVALDLEQPVPPALQEAFDVVFCHTVLEHVFDHKRAIEALREMSRDVVIVVVPFLQDEHYEAGSYEDYWRYTPAGLRRSLEEAGLTVLYLSNNDNAYWPIYLFAFACKHPDRWRPMIVPAGGDHQRLAGRWFHP